jgi:hypothetical protein
MMRSKYEYRLKGAFCTHSLLYEVLTCAVETLTTGDSPVTVTDSSSVPIPSFTSSSTVLPTDTGMPSRLMVAKPESAYSRSYVPGGSTGNR